MPTTEYISKRFSAAHLDIIRTANAILREYRSAGYDMTLRQVYYQFVARGYIENTVQSYKRLGDILNDARLAGLIDWDLMVDRTRDIVDWRVDESPEQVIADAARGYQRDLWERQPVHVELWVEKEALAGVVERLASRWSIPYFACRGNVSQSTMWEAGQRFGRFIEEGQRIVVLHLGDHDPNGIDMTRDMDKRLQRTIAQDRYDVTVGDGDILAGDGKDGSENESMIDAVWSEMDGDCNEAHPDATLAVNNTDTYNVFEMRRIALNIDQVRRFNPPPNPVKFTDSRARGYVAQFGRESWELDALTPDQLRTLVDANMDELVDHEQREEDLARRDREKVIMQAISDRYADVVNFLGV